MAYLIADTGSVNQKLYSFDSSTTANKVDWSLVTLASAEYDFDGSILITPKSLQELKDKGVAVFETKKSAKIAYHKLSISNCRYVELKLKITHEYKLKQA